MQERRALFRPGIAELTALLRKTVSSITQDLLPLLNMMVLLLPIVLLAIEFVAHSAIAVTLPDPSPDVASLDTPPAPRSSVSGSEDHNARSPRRAQTEDTRDPQASVAPEPTPTGASAFSDSPLGYGG
jgi:hypothetical protein